MMKKTFVLIAIFVFFFGCTQHDHLFSIDQEYKSGNYGKIFQYMDVNPYAVQSDSLKTEYLQFYSNLSEFYNSQFRVNRELIITISNDYLQRFPESKFVPYVRYQYANALLLNGDLQIARQELEKCLRIENDNPFYRQRTQKILEMTNEEDPQLKKKVKISFSKKREDYLAILDQLIPYQSKFRMPEASPISDEILNYNPPVFTVEDISKFYDIRLLKLISLQLDAHILKQYQNTKLERYDTWIAFDWYNLAFQTYLRLEDKENAVQTIQKMIRVLEKIGNQEILIDFYNGILSESVTDCQFEKMPEVYQVLGWHLKALLHGKSEAADEFFTKFYVKNIKADDYDKKALNCEEFTPMYISALYYNRFLPEKSPQAFYYLWLRLSGLSENDLASVHCPHFNPALFISEASLGLKSDKTVNEILYNTISGLGKENNAFRILTGNFSLFVVPDDVISSTQIGK
jgi:hypothetical protein